MSELESIKIKCAICGTESSQNISLSLDTPGYFDLDLRPPYLTSDVLHCQIQQCPNCHYCAPMLSKSETRIKNLIRNEEYQKILSDTDTPDLIKKYYAWAYCASEIEKIQRSLFCISKRILGMR